MEEKTLIEKYFEPFPLLHGFSKTWDWLKDVNHCNPFYSPLYYIICRSIKAKNIVEVGCEAGYSSYMMAMAAKENGGTYFGIEKAEGHARRLKKGLDNGGFPNQVIWADSTDIKAWTYSSTVDFVLLDGEHTKDAIEHEFELFYPKLTNYIALHDINAWSSEGFYSIINNPKYDLEYITFPQNYGLALFKKKRQNEMGIIKERAEKEKNNQESQDINWCKTGGKPQECGKIVIL